MILRHGCVLQGRDAQRDPVARAVGRSLTRLRLILSSLRAVSLTSVTQTLGGQKVRDVLNVVYPRINEKRRVCTHVASEHQIFY